jgi:hypothetical protein
MADVVVDYRVAGPTIRRFHASPAFVRGVMGPIGSGKTSAAIMEILLRSAQQAPSQDGVRRTRWCIVRNTYAELKSTTLKSFEQWLPTELGRLTNDAPIVFRLRRGDVDAEFLFIALDREEDQRKLLSLEVTGAWVNEAREVPKGIIDTLTGRVGRFPPMKDGGATWAGVILDSNPCDNEHWWYRAAEVDRPHGWEFFKQPAGDGPDAENLQNLPREYYDRVKAGKDADWIRVYVEGEYGYVVEGRPVYPSFRDAVHVARESIPVAPNLPLLVGADFGLTPAAVLGHRTSDGRWLIVDEVVTDDCGVVRFAQMLAAYVERTYPRMAVEGWCDPAGTQRVQTDERTCLEVMKAHTGWRWHPAPDNALLMRLEAVRGALNRLVDGQPGLLLSPRCAVLRKGFNGGYHFRQARTGHGLTYAEEPAKNAYSHPHDALQYLLSGGGEASVVLRRRERDTTRQQYAESEYDIFGT